MQTSPSGPSLGALSLDNTPKGVERGGSDAEGFSQEYDKQVKNVESREQSEEPEESSTVDNEGRAETPEQAEVTAQSAEQQTEGDELAASEEQQGGNTLPLEQMRQMVAEVQLQVETASQDEAEAAAEESFELAEVETGAKGEVAEQTLAGLVSPPPQASAKLATNQAVAAAVKQASAEKVDVAKTLSTDEVIDEGLVLDEGVLSELPLKSRGKESDFAALMARQSKPGQGAEMVVRGARGFESLLAAQGRSPSAAASVDTLAPTLAPLAGQGAANPLATPVPVAMTLATPMHQANWGQAMAERVVWMTNANIQEAEIQLNPRELGPIGIKVTVQNEQTNVSFVAQNATTREALEQALPRLREMLGEHGLQLGQSDVSQHGFKGRDAEQGEGRANGLGDDETLEADEQLLAGEVAHGVGYATPSGVDAFA